MQVYEVCPRYTSCNAVLHGMYGSLALLPPNGFADISLNITSKKLKIAWITKFNKLFQLLKSIRILYANKAKSNKDVSKELPIVIHAPAAELPCVHNSRSIYNFLFGLQLMCTLEEDL